MRVFWGVIALTLIPTSALTQTPQELLRLAQQSFMDPNGYEFDGAGLLRVDGSSWQVKFKAEIAEAPAPLDTPYAPAHPADKLGGPFQCTKIGEGNDPKPTRFSVPFVVAGGWEKIATNVASVKEVGTERLPLNGEMTDCRVLAVEYDASPNRTPPSPVTYSVCSGKHLVLRKTMIYSAGRLPTDRPGLWTITFDRVHFHRPAPQWLLDMKDLPETMMRKEWLGKEAPLFHLADLDGRSVELSTLRGKAVLLDFWSTACAPCLRELPDIQKIAKEHRADLMVWGVSFDQPDRDKTWLNKHQQDFPTLSDSELEVSELYEVHGIPAVVLIDSRGVVRGYWQGKIPMRDLEVALSKIQHGE